MTELHDITPQPDEDEDGPAFNFLGSIAVALVAGGALAVSARIGALPLLAVVAAVQALLTLAVLFGLAVPARRGSVLFVALAAAASDVTVSVWPHSRLGTLLAVLGLAVPGLIAQQLLRGATRIRVLDSLGGTALAVVLVIALPAFVQLRHEFADATAAGHVVFAAVLSLTAALVVGFFADLVLDVPRFDTEVPRGLLGVLASAVAGGFVGYLTLRDSAYLAGGRGVFVGASLGVLAALVAVGVAFAEVSTPPSEVGFSRRIRPVLAVVVPLAALAPVAFLLCLAIRV